MNNFPACNFPWLGKVVSDYSISTQQYASQVNPSNIDPWFQFCCKRPSGNCTMGWPESCPYASATCGVGNSWYACQILVQTNATSANYCYQDGILANTRDLPCCPPLLNQFMQLPGNQLCSASPNDVACCVGDTVDSCSWESICSGYTAFQCIGANKTGICAGVALVSSTNWIPCAQEYSLNTLNENYCSPVTVPSDNKTCALGGSGPLVGGTSRAFSSLFSFSRTLLGLWVLSLVGPVLLQSLFL